MTSDVDDVSRIVDLLREAFERLRRVRPQLTTQGDIEAAADALSYLAYASEALKDIDGK